MAFGAIKTALAIGVGITNPTDAQLTEYNKNPETGFNIEKIAEKNTPKFETGANMIKFGTNAKALNVLKTVNPAKNPKFSPSLPDFKDYLDESEQSIINGIKNLEGKPLLEYLEKHNITIQHLNDLIDKVHEKSGLITNNINSYRIKISATSDHDYISSYELEIKYLNKFYKENKAWLTSLHAAKDALEAEISRNEIESTKEFTCTIENKSPEVLAWEKENQMEIVAKNHRIRVMHNGESVSIIRTIEKIKGIPTLSLSNDNLIFSYIDEDGNNIVIYTEKNGGITEITENSGIRELFKKGSGKHSSNVN